MNETQVERLFKMALQKRHAGEIEEALEYLERLLSMPESDHRNAFMEKAHILYSLGYYEKCIACIDKCRRRTDFDSDPSTSHLPRGSEWIDGANSYSDIDPEALLLKSLALDKLGKSKEAETFRTKSAAAAEGLSLSGHACDWWAMYSCIFNDLGWTERAIFYQDAILQIDSVNPNPLHEKACQPGNRGKHAKPLPLFEKVIEKGTVD